ncbi:unnamed protein product [Spirodela intermedia]|uniref:Uncharacterized protein n=1 Tax=Spirodela intermedia TaxID=51605 RepID=A0A7I8K0N1_SPIIN|nr:unnamed protein product [Spirodela intermedia]
MEDGGRSCSADPSSNDHMKGESRESPEQAGTQNQTGAGRPERERSEDLTWLWSLPESQLDLLICLKELAILRSRNAGHEELAEKFDPQMLGMLDDAIIDQRKYQFRGSALRIRFSLIPHCPCGSKPTVLLIARGKNPSCGVYAGAFVLEYVKERIKGSSIFPYSSEELESLSGRQMAPQESQTPVTEDSTRLRMPPGEGGLQLGDIDALVIPVFHVDLGRI